MASEIEKLPHYLILQYHDHEKIYYGKDDRPYEFSTERASIIVGENSVSKSDKIKSYTTMFVNYDWFNHNVDYGTGILKQEDHLEWIQIKENTKNRIKEIALYLRENFPHLFKSKRFLNEQ